MTYLRKAPCIYGLCAADGVVFAKEKNGPYENFAFKCACNYGRNLQAAYPVWSDEYFKNYEPMYDHMAVKRPAKQLEIVKNEL